MGFSDRWFLFNLIISDIAIIVVNILLYSIKEFNFYIILIDIVFVLINYWYLK